MNIPTGLFRRGQLRSLYCTNLLHDMRIMRMFGQTCFTVRVCHVIMLSSFDAFSDNCWYYMSDSLGNCRSKFLWNQRVPYFAKYPISFMWNRFLMRSLHFNLSSLSYKSCLTISLFSNFIIFFTNNLLIVTIEEIMSQFPREREARVLCIRMPRRKQTVDYTFTDFLVHGPLFNL